MGNIKTKEVTAEGGGDWREGDLEALFDEGKKFRVLSEMEAIGDFM